MFSVKITKHTKILFHFEILKNIEKRIKHPKTKTKKHKTTTNFLVPSLFPCSTRAHPPINLKNVITVSLNTTRPSYLTVTWFAKDIYKTRERGKEKTKNSQITQNTHLGQLLLAIQAHMDHTRSHRSSKKDAVCI